MSLTKHFLKEWDEGSDSFAKDPPNATISVLSAEGDTVEDAVVVLKSPKLEGDKSDLRGVRARRKPVEGDGTRFPLHRLVRRARLWRSRICRRRRRMAWRVVRHPGWGAVGGSVGLGAAAVGAAAAGAYYHPYAYPYYAPPPPPPACGYYPYPPCY